MLPALIRRPRRNARACSKQRGFTMALVAITMVVIISMAALSIDIGTLYEAKAEAQRAADAAALAAARVISISGITGDTNGASWAAICGGNNPLSTLIATNVAQQNLVGGVAIPSGNVTVNYGPGSGPYGTDCTGAGPAFAVNPVVTVTVHSAKLPIFFARVFSLLPGGVGNYSGATVSATAAAEAFNPSGSSPIIPVSPRCVKPWIIPNLDPGNSTPGTGFVDLKTGVIVNPGVGKVIGESFNLNADCVPSAADCEFPKAPAGNIYDNPPQMRSGATPPFLEYVPALISGTALAVPSCTPAIATTGYQPAVAGCDQSTVYACGVKNGAHADLDENPINPPATGDSSTAAECLINQSAGAGQDLLDTTTFPFKIKAGSGSPLTKAGLFSGNVVTTSNSIVTVPIYDGQPLPGGVDKPAVTIVGFLQVFINSVDTAGNINVTVMNVAGCSNDADKPAVNGTSPVPVRLITTP
jgi:Flp pilus assembly protein TadG